MRLNDAIYVNNLHYLRNIDKFLLLLLRGVERRNDRRPERSWLVMKVVSAVRRLGHVSRQKIISLLQGALGMYGDDSGALIVEWDPEDLQLEVLMVGTSGDKGDS